MTILDQFSTFYTDLASMKIDQLAYIYSEDVEFIDPIASHQGIEAVKTYFSRLLKNAKGCRFTIHSKQTVNSNDFVVTWTMRYSSKSINQGDPVIVDGVTLLRTNNNMIVYHRDYYDLGQMVYENIPILGFLVKKIRKRMA